MSPFDAGAAMDVVSLTIPMAMLMGLAFGAGPCNVTCLPYLGPVLVANEQARPWRTVLPFSLGRLSGYAMLGLVAGMLGQTLQAWLKSPLVGWLLGGATVVVGLSLLWRQIRKRWLVKHAAAQRVMTVSLSAPVSPLASTLSQPACRARGVALPGGLFVMGMGMALNPCAPLGTVLLAASTAGSAVAGLSLGLGFGLGAVVLPTLFFVLGVAHFGQQLHTHLQRWQSGLIMSAGMLLVLLGIATLLGWVHP